MGEGRVENPALRPFDKLRVLSKVEAQAQGGEPFNFVQDKQSRTTKGGGEGYVNLFIAFVLALQRQIKYDPLHTVGTIG